MVATIALVSMVLMMVFVPLIKEGNYVEALIEQVAALLWLSGQLMTWPIIILVIMVASLQE